MNPLGFVGLVLIVVGFRQLQDDPYSKGGNVCCTIGTLVGAVALLF